MIGYSELRRIITSRFKIETDFSKERMKICNKCEHNSKNKNKISIKQKILNKLSSLVTFILTGRFNEDNSVCTICTCTIIYKVVEELEECNHPIENQWKSIYIPNKK